MTYKHDSHSQIESTCHMIFAKQLTIELESESEKGDCGEHQITDIDIDQELIDNTSLLDKIIHTTSLLYKDITRICIICVQHICVQH